MVHGNLFRANNSTRAKRGKTIMTSWNGNIFRVTGPLCGEFTGHRWIPLTKATDAEHWCFLWSAPQQTLNNELRRWWFETQSRPLWRHSYALCILNGIYCHYIDVIWMSWRLRSRVIILCVQELVHINIFAKNTSKLSSPTLRPMNRKGH